MGKAVILLIVANGSLYLADNLSDPFMALAAVLTGIVLWIAAAMIFGYQVYRGLVWVIDRWRHHTAAARREQHYR